MAKSETLTDTVLTVAQKKVILALGTSMTEIRNMCEEGLTFEEQVELSEAAKGAKDSDDQASADRQAKATKRAMKPENESAPRTSVFHPLGWDQKAIPECATYWAGADVRGDVDSDDEIRAMNKIQAGTYRCTKSDGSTVKVIVEVQRDERGTPVERKFSFPTSGLNMRNHGSRLGYLAEMKAQQPEPITKPVELIRA